MGPIFNSVFLVNKLAQNLSIFRLSKKISKIIDFDADWKIRGLETLLFIYLFVYSPDIDIVIADVS